jgi:hypothetical protein
MALYTDIFGRLDWLTKTVKALCCSVDQIKEEAATQAANNPCYLELVWSDIVSAPYNTVSDYNANINHTVPFTTLVTAGNTQRLYGGGGVDLGPIFTSSNPTALLSINDACKVVVSIQNDAFNGAAGLQYANFPGLINLGQTPGDDNVFANVVTGTTVTLTVPIAQQTIDSGNPDGDILTLLTNNPGSTVNYI